MKFNNRKDIAIFIDRIEKEFNVNEWKVNDIHFWPLIRIELFFFLARLESKKSVAGIVVEKSGNSKAVNISLIAQLIKLVRFYFNLPKKKYVFVGSDAHRVSLNHNRFNRFFDPIIDSLNIRKESQYLEYGKLNKAKYYHEENIIGSYAIQKSYLFVIGFFSRIIKQKINIQFDGYQTFLDLLSENELTKDFAKKFSIKYLTNTYLKTFLFRYSFYSIIFKKIKPKKIFVLCYYDYQILPLVAAANRLNIETIDFQHGPQPEVHLAYSGWNRIPPEGYSVLPKQYWNWDNTSSNNIKKWASRTTINSSFMGGNTWISYWDNLKNDYAFKNYILYSLQPDPLDINDLFCKNIINSIKENNFIWFVRLHPRQMEMIEVFKNFAFENGISNKVNFENASNDPLPVLLRNAIFHVTHFSGTAMEAAMLGKHSILLHPNALDCFPDLIENKNATFINYCSSDFQEKFNDFITMLMNTKQQENVYRSIDYSDYFK